MQRGRVTLAGVFPGGYQFGSGSFSEGGCAHIAEHLIGVPELPAGAEATSASP
jgi:hypothetical protein